MGNLLEVIVIGFLISMCFCALHLLCAVQLITKEVISFSKAFVVTVIVYVLTFIVNLISFKTLISSELIFSQTGSILMKPSGIELILICLVLFLPNLLISWFLNSTFITLGEYGEKDYKAGLLVTLTYYGLLILTSILISFAFFFI